MAKLVWDNVGERFYETGVDHGVLYPLNPANSTYDTGVVWNGLSSVNESPSGAEATAVWADNIKYLNLYSAEEFGATIECYTYPDEFKAMNGEATLAEGVTIGQQSRGTFGLSYRTKIGNDVSEDLGYKIHIIYGAKASPSEKSYSTVNDSPEAMSLSYELTTTPVAVTGYKPTATLVIDSTKTDADKLAAIESILYGSDGTPGSSARLPLPDEVMSILNVSMTASPSSVSVASGSTSDAVTITITPTQTPEPTITWTSANTSIATVASGAVTGVAAGTTTVTAAATIDGVTYHASIPVTVTGG